MTPYRTFNVGTALHVQSDFSTPSVALASTLAPAGVLAACMAFASMPIVPQGTYDARELDYTWVSGHPSTLGSLGDVIGCDAASVSWFDSPVWLEPAVKGFIDRSRHLSIRTLASVRSAVSSVFPSAAMSSAVYVDTDERWEKVVLSINTGVDDVDVRMDHEDKLFEFLECHPELKSALSELVLSFS